jgi:hypothetical protein
MNLINNRHKHNGAPIFSSPFPVAAYCAMPGDTSSDIEHKTRSKNRFFVAVPETNKDDVLVVKSFIGNADRGFDGKLLKRA